MLQFIRDNTKGFIAWIIVGLLIIPFALWGMSEYFTGGSANVVVAEIGDREVPAREFQILYQQELAARRQASQGNFDPSESAVKKDVMDRMINSEVLSQAAINAGFRISDERLGQQIRSMSEFQSNGRFNAERYERLLQLSGLTSAQFEENLRRDLMMQQMMAGISETALLTGHEIDQWLRLSEQQRRFGYLLLETDAFQDRVEVSEDEISSWYHDNRDQFAIPEQVKARYVELSLSRLQKDVDVDEQAVRSMYERRAESLAVGEERRVRHILIELDPDADAEAIQRARERAEELRGRIAEGESFAALAREFSDDPGSAGNGGDLGLISRGTVVEGFSDAAFALEEGELSEPVRTSFGFHLIRIDEIRPGMTRSFAELRDSLEREYRQTRAEDRFFELTELLDDLAFEHPETLEVAAEELDLEVRETNYFSRDRGSGIAANPDVREAAFSEDVLESGYNSPLVELDQDSVLILRVADRQPASHRPLEEVRESIVRQLRAEGAARLAEQEGKRMLESIEAGEPIAEVAGRHGVEWHSEIVTGRDDPALPLDLLSTAFSMKAPAGDQPRIEGTPLFTGDYAIIALREVIDGSPEQIAGEKRRREEDRLARQLQRRHADQLLQSLKDRYDVRVFEDRL